MGKYLKLALLASLLMAFLPGTSLAYSVQSLGSAVSASTNQNLYRLRSANKAWQLSALSADQLSDTPMVLNNKVVFTAKTGSVTQVVVSGGLDYQPLAALNGDAVRLASLPSGVVAVSQTGSALSASLINPDFSVTLLAGTPLTSLDQINHFFSFNGALYYGEQLNQFVRILRWQGTGWVITGSFPCSSSALVTAPLAGFSCAEGQFYYPLNDSNWQPLFPVTVQNISAAGSLIAASDAQNNLYVWQNNLLGTYALSLGGRSLQALKLVANRIFIKLSDATWWEFNLADHNLSATPGDVSNVTAADGASRLFVKIGNTYFTSDAVNNWQPVITDGDFSALKKVAGGWLAWLDGGSVVQFSADASTIFKKVTGSWATTSKIQAVYSQGNLGLILLLNSSSSPNLYQSADYQNWSRLTLPSAPTYVLPISQVRNLPANSLAEVSGVISVPAGVVSSETLYLQDQTAGLQIFLDSSKGLLPTFSGKAATASGQISTSQTKHLVLTALDDLVVGADSVLSLTPLGVDDLANNLGLATTTQAAISDAGSGYYSLATAGGALKFHYPAGLLNFLKGSIVNLPLVTDYNSSSGAIESWYLGSGATVVSAPAVADTVTSSLVTPAATTAKTIASKSSRASASSKPPAVAAVLASTPQAAAISNPAQPTLVSAQKENDTAQTVALAVASFLAGALAMRGRRLQNLLGG